MINYHLTITGRVQGVGFRWSVYQLAQQAGIEGIVMNKNDFINTICEATEKLIAAAKLENPREMKPLFTDVPIGDNESVNICAEYEFTDDGDIDDLWIYFYSF